MKSVFLLQHLHTLPSGEEDVKSIGVYSTLELAREAVSRLKAAPGFRDHPMVIDPLEDDSTDGFYIDEYTIDQDNWAEGYVTEGA